MEIILFYFRYASYNLYTAVEPQLFEEFNSPVEKCTKATGFNQL